MRSGGFGWNQQGFEQRGEDQIVTGFCGRCCRNRTLARYHRKAPPPEQFTALCAPCLLKMLTLLFEE